ncbi:unnamed protein product, partial [Vitis vinifera]
MKPKAILDTRWVNKGSSFVKKALSSGKSFQKNMLRGKIPKNYATSILTSTLRTRFD